MDELNGFRVGELVEFKTLDEMLEEYGGSPTHIPCQFGFLHSMMFLCGQQATIKSIDDTGHIQFNESAVQTIYAIGTDMIKHVSAQNVEPREFDMDAFVALITKFG